MDSEQIQTNNIKKKQIKKKRRIHAGCYNRNVFSSINKDFRSGIYIIFNK